MYIFKIFWNPFYGHSYRHICNRFANVFQNKILSFFVFLSKIKMQLVFCFRRVLDDKTRVDLNHLITIVIIITNEISWLAILTIIQHTNTHTHRWTMFFLATFIWFSLITFINDLSDLIIVASFFFCCFILLPMLNVYDFLLCAWRRSIRTLFILIMVWLASGLSLLAVTFLFWPNK